MDYQLHNLRTGEALTLKPHGTLIGTADHVDIKTREGGPFIAVLVVRYPSGWVIHGLSNDPAVKFDRAPLGVGERGEVQSFKLLEVGSDRYRFIPTMGSQEQVIPDVETPSCFVYVRSPDGLEECRSVDHDLLIGRLAYCHVRFSDTKISRLHALIASHCGGWYVHSLAKRPVMQNGDPIRGYKLLENEDTLIVGSLVIRVEIQSSDGTETPVTNTAPRTQADESTDLTDSAESVTDCGTSTDDTPDPGERPVNRAAFLTGAVKLDNWLKSQTPTQTPHAKGIGGWIEAQKDRLSRFWYDTPEATSARSLRSEGKMNEAFAVLDRAVRARPDSPGLLRELYRLYEATGLIELCYRPLRQIEKLSILKEGEDTWVLETLARLCERLGSHRQGMFDRSVGYWRKLEAVTRVSYARERAAVMATRALREGGFSGATEEGG